MTKEQLISAIIDAATTVKIEMGTGFLEGVYQHALQYELSLRGIHARIEVPIDVTYKGHKVGFYRADLFVENSVIVETKVCDEISKAHEYQLVNYLQSTGIDDGILINFGSNPIGFRRKYRTYNKKTY